MEQVQAAARIRGAAEPPERGRAPLRCTRSTFGQRVCECRAHVVQGQVSERVDDSTRDVRVRSGLYRECRGMTARLSRVAVAGLAAASTGFVEIATLGE